VAHKLDRNAEIDQAAEAGVILRDARGRPRRRLSARTINMSLDVISKVLKDAAKRGFISGNPAADPGLRLKVPQRRGNFLEADELLAIIDAGGQIDRPTAATTLARAELARRWRDEGKQWKEIAAELEVATSTASWLASRRPTEGGVSVRRAILATLGCAGLRNGEVCALDLVDLNFAHSILNVRDAKTEAGIRRVNMTPWLREQLLEYRATHPRTPTPRSPPSRPAVVPDVTATTSIPESSLPPFKRPTRSEPNAGSSCSPTRSPRTPSGAPTSP
jgi:integrase